MKKLALLCSIFIGITPTYLSATEGKSYFTVSAGASKAGDIDVENVASDIEFETGTSFDIGLGYDFGKTRLEGTYQKHQTDGATFSASVIESDASSDSLIGTIYYDFRDEKLWSPFIGASLGYSSVEVDGESDSSFTYGVAYGVSYETSPTTDIFFKAHTIIFTQLDYTSLEVWNANATSATLGVRYTF